MTRRQRLDITRLARATQGRIVSDLEIRSDQLLLHFNDGSYLAIAPTARGTSVVLHEIAAPAAAGSKDGPTRRQREYLDFIRKYMARYGRSPAESDIQEHFMVSAPSAHLMVKTLERRGFITRARDWYGNAVPRSIRVVLD